MISVAALVALYTSSVSRNAATGVPPAASATPPPTQAASAPTPDITPDILKVPELGMKFALSPGISDAYYAMGTGPLSGYAEFSTRSLAASGGAECAPGTFGQGDTAVQYYPIGAVTASRVSPAQQSAAPGTDESSGLFIKQLGSVYLYYKSPQSACAQTASGADALQTGQIAGLRQALQAAQLLP